MQSKRKMCSSQKRSWHLIMQRGWIRSGPSSCRKTCLTTLRTSEHRDSSFFLVFVRYVRGLYADGRRSVIWGNVHRNNLFFSFFRLFFFGGKTSHISVGINFPTIKAENCVWGIDIEMNPHRSIHRAFNLLFEIEIRTSTDLRSLPLILGIGRSASEKMWSRVDPWCCCEKTRNERLECQCVWVCKGIKACLTFWLPGHIPKQSFNGDIATINYDRNHGQGVNCAQNASRLWGTELERVSVDVYEHGWK